MVLNLGLTFYTIRIRRERRIVFASRYGRPYPSSAAVLLASVTVNFDELDLHT